MDRLLFFGGLLVAAIAAIVLLSSFFYYKSKKKHLESLLEAEYGPRLELYENGVRNKTRTDGRKRGKS